MFRLLSILALGALCIFPDRASADPPWSRESLTSATISRQRIIYHRRYRSAYLTIGYDPLHTASAHQRYGGRPIGTIGRAGLEAKK